MTNPRKLRKRKVILTQSQEQFIRDNWRALSDKELAEHLKISHSILTIKRTGMGIKRFKGRKDYTKEIQQGIQLVDRSNSFETRACPRNVCDGVAERGELVLVCSKCYRVWYMGSIKREEELAEIRKGNWLSCRSIGTNRKYTARKLSGGRSIIIVEFPGANKIDELEFIWEDFLDMFYVEV